jgi:predicted anti-sigma-YlaC factor YlaD
MNQPIPMTAARGLLLTILALMAFPACSIKQAAFSSVSDMLAPPASAKAPDKNSAMLALTGENDPELVADFFPTALKIYEIMHLQNPKHAGLAVMTGQLYITYANAFVQQPASELPSERFNEQNAEYLRAQNFYLRGKGFALDGLEIGHPGFGKAILGVDETAMRSVLAKCARTDVPALYWASAGTLAAWSLDPMNTKLLALAPGAVQMLTRAAELDPGYNSGAIWEILVSFYAAAPESLGGDPDAARDAYEKALSYSGGKSPATHIAYARSFCIPSQDGAGFDEAIGKALAIDPESQPDNRLALVLAHRQAMWLKNHKSDFILE